jgi:hypothetical protein
MRLAIAIGDDARRKYKWSSSGARMSFKVIDGDGPGKKERDRERDREWAKQEFS